ncbi:unnamed protein product [Diamesa serratosioi]
MTKLGEWLFGLTLFFGVYMAVVSKQVKHELIDKYFFEIQILPLILIVLLGIYAVTTVLYRTLTFNNCDEAAKELKKEIVEARTHLKAKGFVFSELES